MGNSNRKKEGCISFYKLISASVGISLLDDEGFVRDFEDNPRNLLKAKEDVDVDPVFNGSSLSICSSVLAGSPATTIFSIRGDVDVVPTVVISLVLLIYRSNKGVSVDLDAFIRN